MLKHNHHFTLRSHDMGENILVAEQREAKSNCDGDVKTTDSQGGERFSEGHARDSESTSTWVTSALLWRNPAFSEFLPCPGCKNVPSLGDRYKCMKLSCFT